MSQTYNDIVVLGAGASGLLFGSFIKQNVTFIDSNSYFGAKIKISGGGKCNITNEKVDSTNYLDEENFSQNALSNFSSKDTLNFLAEYSVYPNIRDCGKYFCNSSSEILSIFHKTTSKHKFIYSTKVEDVIFKDNLFFIKTDKDTYSCKKLIVSSGGISFSALGASDIGYKIASSFNHSIVKVSPALVGLTLQKDQFWMKDLSGIAFNVKVKCNNYIYTDNILFSHRGISGPVILNTSLRWEKGAIEIDFLPKMQLQHNHKIWNDKKQLTSLVSLPKRFTKSFLKSIDIEDKPTREYNKEEKDKIAILKNYYLSPSGTFGFSKAEVSKGGIDTNEVDSVTFESKKQKNLYFIGEVLNVTGELGGFNIQWAFSSAVSCAKHI